MGRRTLASLTPLAYHREIATRLQALEPRGWGLFASAALDRGAPSAPPGAQPQGTSVETSTDASIDPGPEAVIAQDDLEQQLLRHAYRMEAAAHPRVHAAAARAAAALELDVPIAIYQLEGAAGANAALAFRPYEAVVAISGNLLALLTDDELAACFGHELAHHRLWSADGGQILVADRFLSALSMDAASPAWYLETARRFDLATELYADRGSLEASGSLDVAIAGLVKVATGLSEVDPAAYLRQARDARPSRGADGTSHPETVLRAWALERWQAGEGDAAAETLLAPSLDIERLDLIDRERLETVTRRLVVDALAVDWMRTEDVTSHAKQFLVDSTPVDQPPARPTFGWFDKSPVRAAADRSATAPVATRLADETPDETRRFLSYVLLDLATVDADLGDESLVEMLAVAREAGLGATFEEVARKELALTGRAWDGIRRRSATRRQPPDGTGEAAPPAEAPPTAELPTSTAGNPGIESPSTPAGAEPPSSSGVEPPPPTVGDDPGAAPPTPTPGEAGP